MIFFKKNEMVLPSELLSSLSPQIRRGLGQGLFGIYVDMNSSVTTRDNVRLLLPYLWPMISDDVKRGFGVRYARFIANHDQQQAVWAREVLDLVGATSYLPEVVPAASQS